MNQRRSLPSTLDRDGKAEPYSRRHHHRPRELRFLHFPRWGETHSQWCAGRVT